MKVREIVIALMISIFQQGNGQGVAAGAESAALAGISTVLENAWSVLENPAGLAGFNHLSLNTSVEQRYLVTSIGYYAMAATCPVQKGTLGLGTTYEGFRVYRKNRFSLAYGRPFTGAISGGISLDYFNQSAGKESPTVHQVSFSFGLGVNISNRLSMAFSTFNPFRLYFKNHDHSTLPSEFKLGLAYRPSTSLDFLAEVAKNLDYRTVFRLACEYRIQQLFFIRAGLQLVPFSYSLGAGFLVKKVTVNLATGYHQYLGFTPSTSLQYLIK